MASYLEFGAMLLAVVALCVSYLFWRTSEKAIRATTFDQKHKIYSDAEGFVGAWIREGCPDLELLLELVDAWGRSQFLCREEVTRHLRSLWTDAVRATELSEIMASRVDGDRPKAVKEFHELFRAHADYDRLRSVFMRDLEIR